MEVPQQGHLLSPICAVQSLVVTILLAVCISDIVLLITSYCSFQVEAIPIGITCIFGLGAVDKACVYLYKQHDASSLMLQQRDPLLQAQNMDDFHTAKPPKDYMACLGKCYNKRMSTVGVGILCVLDCIPFALCTLWIYALLVHPTVSQIQEPICQTRYWYSLAQSTLFTPLSFCGIIHVTIIVHGLCKRNSNRVYRL